MIIYLISLSLMNTITKLIITGSFISIFLIFTFSCEVLENNLNSNEPQAVLILDKIELNDSDDFTLKDYQSFHKGLNQFTNNLYHSISSSKPQSNIFFSPSSINSALGLLYFGLDGEGKDDLENALNFEGIPLSQLMKSFQKMNSKTSDEIIISSINDVWIDNGLELLEEYSSIIKNYFYSTAHQVSFFLLPEESRNRINESIESNTNGKIKNLLPEGSIDSSTKIVLTNAIYFNATWQHTFNSAATKEQPFYKIDGNSIVTPMMKTSSTFNYSKQKDIHIIELPYKGSEYSMILYYPENPSTFDYSTLPSVDLQSLSKERIDLTIPKFSLEDNYSLSDTLKELGLTSLFEYCDLSKMTTYPDLAVDDIYHKTFVSVSEDGTEAAAATGIVIAERAAFLDLELSLILNHPFLFTISHRLSGETLFVGSLFDPSQ